MRVGHGRPARHQAHVEEHNRRGRSSFSRCVRGCGHYDSRSARQHHGSPAESVAAVLGLAWSNVAQDVLDKCDLRAFGAAALGVSSAASLDDPVKYPFFFRTGYSDLHAASLLVDNIARTLGWSRIALLGTPENAFGLSGIQGVNASVERTAGMEILEYVPFRVGASNAELQAAVNRAASMHPDGFIVSAPGPDTRSVFRAAAVTGHVPAADKGVSPPLWLATEKVEIDPKDTEAMRGAADYISYAPPSSDMGRSSESDAFIEAFRLDMDTHQIRGPRTRIPRSSWSQTPCVEHVQTGRT